MTRAAGTASCLLDPPHAVIAWADGASAPVSGVFRVKPAVEPWELRGYSRLRHEVFCREQRLFSPTDRDEHDAYALPIVAVSYAAVMDGDVVGAVRIYEQSPGEWWGSRLAVDREWRGVPSLAAGLIRAAVATAAARGCRSFRAAVQLQNVPLFRRLRWRPLGDVEVCGLPHQLMEADPGVTPCCPGNVATSHLPELRERGRR